MELFDGMWCLLKRLCAVLLCLSLLAVPVRGEEAKYVALTFDDGPSGRFTRRLLDGLAQRKAKATFLLCGYRMAEQPELTQRIFDEGHEIGLHGYSHKCMRDLCRQELERELNDTAQLLPEGCRPTFLRPPGGASNATVRQTAERAGLALLTWSVDPRDWDVHDPQAVENAVLKTVQDGDIVLLHDMTDSSVEAALYIADALKSQGYRLVTVSELAALRSVTPLPGKEYSRFPPE